MFNRRIRAKTDPLTGKLRIRAVDLVLPGNGGLDSEVHFTCPCK
jgi:hypothetical protein